jgi:hypothetical protein
MHAAERIGVGVLYLVLGLGYLLRDRRRMRLLVRDAFTASYAELGAERVQDALGEAEAAHPSPSGEDTPPASPPR